MKKRRVAFARSSFPLIFLPLIPFGCRCLFCTGGAIRQRGGRRDGAWGANLPFPSIPLCGKGSRNNSNNKEEKGRQEEEEEEEEEAGPPVMTP